MNQATTVLLGAIAGATIFLGLPVARLRGLPRAFVALSDPAKTEIVGKADEVARTVLSPTSPTVPRSGQSTTSRTT